MKKILITGVAGFIGYHLAEKLLNNNYQIIGIDNLNDYYDPILKQDRLTKLNKFSNFEFHKIDFIQNNKLTSIFNNKSILSSNTPWCPSWSKIFHQKSSILYRNQYNWIFKYT